MAETFSRLQQKNFIAFIRDNLKYHHFSDAKIVSGYFITEIILHQVSEHSFKILLYAT
jgi:hypothetical protein